MKSILEYTQGPPIKDPKTNDKVSKYLDEIKDIVETINDFIKNYKDRNTYKEDQSDFNDAVKQIHEAYFYLFAIIGYLNEPLRTMQDIDYALNNIKVAIDKANRLINKINK